MTDFDHEELAHPIHFFLRKKNNFLRRIGDSWTTSLLPCWHPLRTHGPIFLRAPPQLAKVSLASPWGATMDEFLPDFLVECTDKMASIDQDLVALERNPGDAEMLTKIFRAIHTVKGSCGMFGFHRLERVAHVAEDALALMRDGKLAISPLTVGGVLKAVDIIKGILQKVEETKAEPTGDDAAVIQELLALMGNGSDRAKEEPATAPPPAAVDRDEAEKKPKDPEKRSHDQSLRVSIDVLDQLMNLVGELVLTRNQLIQLIRGDDESKYHAPIQHLNRVTSGLQGAVMKTRMQPIGNAWGKLPRIVRDLAVGANKQIELAMSGQETEIDRQVLEAIQDPLIHCVRNSADHGIEMPEKRQAAGKAPTGTISLNAFHEGGHIVIEIRDDGAGINVAAVRAKAVERGLVKKETAEQLSDERVSQFIFEPGFSTAAKVTEISGRGVGMDVVRTNIEKIGGSVDLSSRPGQGTTLRIKIPLTLAIISALIVKTGGAEGEVFAIPQVGVLELVRISESNKHLLDEIHGSRVLRLRDKLLPLVDLASVLGLARETDGGARRDFALVVAQLGDTQVGICVDEIFDTQEIVVKPVGRLLRENGLFAGSTILGNGRVILILDTTRIAARALSGATSGSAICAEEGERLLRAGDKTTLLLFRGGDSAPLAVPLALISRLEEFPAAQAERVDGRCLVQYRGGLLPLIPCQSSVEVTGSAASVPAIIFSDGSRSMGLVVKEVLDIVEEEMKIESSGKKPGILGAAIVAGRATEIIDTYHFLQTAYPDWFDSQRKMTKGERLRVLLADDSGFFRDLLRATLESRGYSVLVACDGAQAFAYLEAGEQVDLVLSDIEMPELDGLELARRIRANPDWSRIPLLALTSLASPDDRARGLAAGFSDYLVKFDQDLVLSTIQGLLKSEAKAADAREAEVTA